MASLQTGDGVTVVALRKDALFDSLDNSPTDALPVRLAVMSHQHECRVLRRERPPNNNREVMLT